jgi:hypothetical protein
MLTVSGSVPEAVARAKATCFIVPAAHQSYFTEDHLNEHLTSSRFSPFLLSRVPHPVENKAHPKKIFIIRTRLAKLSEIHESSSFSRQ